MKKFQKCLQVEKKNSIHMEFHSFGKKLANKRKFKPKNLEKNIWGISATVRSRSGGDVSGLHQNLLYESTCRKIHT